MMKMMSCLSNYYDDVTLLMLQLILSQRFTGHSETSNMEMHYAKLYGNYVSTISRNIARIC